MLRLIKKYKYGIVMVLCWVNVFICGAVVVPQFYSSILEYRVVREIGRSEAEQVGVSYEKELENCIVTVDGSVSDSKIAYAKAYLSAVPYDIRNKFFQDGYQLILTDKNIQENYYSGESDERISGVFHYSSKRIYVYASYYDIRNSLVHEFGHYFDYINDWESSGDRFATLYDEEKAYLKDVWSNDGHNSSSTREFYAGVFSRYIVYNKECSIEVPQSYEYMRNSIEKFNSGYR